MTVGPYPWDFLEQVPRRAVRAARPIRARLGSCVNLEHLGRELGKMTSSDVRVVVRRLTPSAAAPDAASAVHLLTADGAAAVALAPEPALASVLIARVLGRQPGLTPPDTPLDPAARGALSALAIEAARRSGAGESFRASADAPTQGAGIRVDATVLVDDASYGVSVFAWELRPTAAIPRARAAADFPVTLVVVAAVSSAPRADVRALGVGDVWFPGGGWLSGGREGADAVTQVTARLAIAAPNGERGVEVGRSGDGGIVLRSAVVALGADSDAPAPRPVPDAMADPDETLTQIAAEAAIVVRVEVGAVTLPASEWGRLRPGDVLETGVPIAEPVVLRIAGQEVARGELVNVDGEVGVRIRELSTNR